MTVKVKFEYKMEFYMKTWSDLAINGTGFWQVNEEELAWEFNDSDFSDFKKFLENYFVSFNGLDLDNIILTVDEDDLKQLENEVRMYL